MGFGKSAMAERVKSKKPEIEGLITGILSNAKSAGAHELKAWKKPEADLRRLVKHDYVTSLRRNMDYHQLRQLVDAFNELLPEFNRETTGMMSIDRFSEMASDMKFHFKAEPYEGPEGLALRGFYVTRNQGVLKRPLIYVNTAHHPLAVSATFCHELAHHFSSELFEAQADEPVHFFFDADYAAHLNEPGELASDAMVSLAAYPEPMARKAFASEWNWGLVARAKNLPEAALAEVQKHLKKIYGFNLMERIPPDRRLHYLAGMIHYAKLRWALLIEFDL
jgi:hypothetical protein